MDVISQENMAIRGIYKQHLTVLIVAEVEELNTREANQSSLTNAITYD